MSEKVEKALKLAEEIGHEKARCIVEKRAHVLAMSDSHDCSCGKGKLGPKQYNDGQYLGGFNVSRECQKCGMLHFFQS